MKPEPLMNEKIQIQTVIYDEEYEGVLIWCRGVAKWLK